MNLDDEQNLPYRVSSDLAALETGITTRVLAERIRALNQPSTASGRKENTPSSSRRSSSSKENNRPPSRFLTGTAIPNSVIQLSLNTKEPPQKDENTLRKERDEHVSQLVKNFLLKHKRRSYDEATDLEALAKIRKELQTRSSISHAESNKENEDEESAKTENTVTKKDSKEAIREKRRVSCRTELFTPVGCKKAPTLDSVRRAVENANAKLSKVLINADELMPKPRRQLSSGTDETPELMLRHPSSFITKRKFVSKLEKARGTKNKEQTIEILQPGINRPSVTLERENELTVWNYPSRRSLQGKTNSEKKFM